MLLASIIFLNICLIFFTLFLTNLLSVIPECFIGTRFTFFKCLTPDGSWLHTSPIFLAFVCFRIIYGIVFTCWDALERRRVPKSFFFTWLTFFYCFVIFWRRRWTRFTYFIGAIPDRFIWRTRTN